MCPKFFWANKYFLPQNIFAPKNFYGPKFFPATNFLVDVECEVSNDRYSIKGVKSTFLVVESASHRVELCKRAFIKHNCVLEYGWY